LGVLESVVGCAGAAAAGVLAGAFPPGCVPGDVFALGELLAGFGAGCGSGVTLGDAGADESAGDWSGVCAAGAGLFAPAFSHGS
jgi:hypothetical protein